MLISCQEQLGIDWSEFPLLRAVIQHFCIFIVSRFRGNRWLFSCFYSQTFQWAYSQFETKKYSFLKCFLNVAFYKKCFSSFIFGCAFGTFGKKNTNLRVMQTLQYYNTHTSFFTRTINFCLRLGAQNYDTNSRLSLFFLNMFVYQQVLT